MFDVLLVLLDHIPLIKIISQRFLVSILILFSSVSSFAWQLTLKMKNQKRRNVSTKCRLRWFSVLILTSFICVVEIHITITRGVLTKVKIIVNWFQEDNIFWFIHWHQIAFSKFSDLLTFSYFSASSCDFSFTFTKYNAERNIFENPWQYISA